MLEERTRSLTSDLRLIGGLTLLDKDKQVTRMVGRAKGGICPEGTPQGHLLMFNIHLMTY